MSEFQPFQRKTFAVTAARVTPANIEELAEACGGKIFHDGEKEGQFSRDYIKVRVAYPLNDEQTRAHVGDWLVKQGRNFKVYKDKPFRNTFETPTGDAIPNQQKQQKQGPSPASMPKHLPEGTPGPETMKALAKEETVEQTSPEGTTPSTVQETPQFPENSPEEKVVEQAVTGETEVQPIEHEVQDSGGQVVHEVGSSGEPAQERELLPDEELREAGFPTSVDPDYQPIYRDEVEEQGSSPVEDTPKKSISLDELNEQPGDTRTVDEIMRSE